MLEAFLYDLKKEISIWSVIKKSTWIERLEVGIYFLIAALLIYFTVQNNLLLMFLLLLVLSCAVSTRIIPKIFGHMQKEKKQKKSSRNIKNKKQNMPAYVQMKWFREKRVHLIKKMLMDNEIGISASRCIDLLLIECDRKARETRPSEIAKRKIKPVLVPIGIVFVTLSTAQLNANVLSVPMEMTSSASEWFTSILSILATELVCNENTLTLFVILCVYLVLFYILYAFIILPFVISILDRDWELSLQLKSVLLYIQHDDLFYKKQEEGAPSNSITV